MNTNNQKTNTPYARKISPIWAYLVERELFECIPKDVFTWSYSPLDSASKISRLESWDAGDLANGNLTTICERLLSENIQPVVVIQAKDSNDDDEWFEKYTTFTEKFQHAAQIRIIIDEHDENFSDLCQELFFPDPSIINIWSVARLFANKDLSIWPDSPSINSRLFPEYGNAVTNWLSAAHHRVELEDAFDYEILDDPERDFDATELVQNQIGNKLRFSLKGLPFIGGEGKVANNEISECLSTGFISETFARRVITNIYAATKTQRQTLIQEAMRFFPDAWKVKADRKLEKDAAMGASSSEPTARGNTIIISSTKAPKYKLTFKIDYQVDGDSFVVLEVPKAIESKKLAIDFGSRYQLNLMILNTDGDMPNPASPNDVGDVGSVYCEKRGVHWIGRLTLSQQSRLNAVADVWDEFTVSDIDKA